MDLQKRSESLVKAKKSLVDKTAADKLHKAGKFTAYDLVAQLFDDGTFVETNAYVKAYANELATSDTEEYEGVVCGYGAGDGRLTFAYAQNAARLNGAFSKAAAEKIAAGDSGDGAALTPNYLRLSQAERMRKERMEQ